MRPVLRGIAPEHVTDFVVPLGQGLVGYTALANNVLRTSDAARHPSFSREHEDFVPEGFCSCICIPVSGSGRPQEKPKVYGILKVAPRSRCPSDRRSDRVSTKGK